VRTILHKVYELLVVLVHRVGTLLKVQEFLLLVVQEAVEDVVLTGTLLKVQELLLLAVHEAAEDVVLTESIMELSSWHLVAGRKGGSEGHPPGTSRSMELLGHKQRLLNL
jgi:hypothetical protein